MRRFLPLLLPFMLLAACQEPPRSPPPAAAAAEPAGSFAGDAPIGQPFGPEGPARASYLHQRATRP